MSKFVWYIIDLEDGSCAGTNDTDALMTSGLLKDEGILVLHQGGDYVNPETGQCDQPVLEFQFPDDDGLEPEPDEDGDIPGTGDEE